MARQEEVTAWILRNDERFDLRVQELSWIKPIFPGWHDIQVSISIFGERFFGRGSDREINTAFGKAVCEAVERATCFKHGISSVGVAGHVDLALARENARLEYIERFCFSRQIEKGLALEPLSTNENLSQRYASLGVEVGFYLLASPVETVVVLCLADGKRAEPSFGGVLGLGAAADLNAARQKALMEALRSLEFYLHGKPPAISREAFQKIERPRSLDRQALLRDRDYFSGLLASLQEPMMNFHIPEGRFEELKLDRAFGDCPLVFVRYSTPTPVIQPEFLG